MSESFDKQRLRSFNTPAKRDKLTAGVSTSIMIGKQCIDIIVLLSSGGVGGDWGSYEECMGFRCRSRTYGRE